MTIKYQFYDFKIAKNAIFHYIAVHNNVGVYIRLVPKFRALSFTPVTKRFNPYFVAVPEM